MINIQTHIISEAFEQLSKSAKLDESKFRESNTQFDIHAVLNANGEYEDLTEVVKDPSKIIIYDTWDQMLKDRDNLHTYYIRQNGDKEYEVMKYSKWSGDQYVGYVGPHGYSSLKELYDRNPGKYDDDDVCLVKEFHIEEKLSESKLTEATIPGYKFDKDDIDMKIKAKDPELHIRLKDAAKLAQYLDSKGIPYKIRNIQDPITKQKLKGFIIHDYFYPKKNKSEKVEESKLTEAPMDVKDYAARLKARKAEKGQNPLEKINSQIDPDMSITDQLQVYFDELVPAQGKADTVAGELVRAMMRVLYRDYNDGDLFYSGYGKETCGGSVVYLMDKVEDLERPFSNIVENQYEDQYYTEELEEAAYLLIEYLNNHPELFTQKNEEDSRNVDENRLDDYFSLPLYEFEPDTSYDESYYAVSDDDIDEFIRGVVSSDLSSGDVNRWARDGWTIVDLEKEDYDTLQEMWDRWFRDFLVDYERQEEDEYEDEEDFEESLNEASSYKSGDRYYGGLPAEPSFSEYGKAMQSRQERRKALIVFSAKVSEFDESTDYDKIFADSVKKIEFDHGFDTWWFERIDEDTWGKYERSFSPDYTTTTDEIRKDIHEYIKNGFKTMRITALRATPVQESLKEKVDDDRFKRSMLTQKIFYEYPDISEDDEDYLNSLSYDALVKECKNRGWEDLLKDFEESLNESNKPLSKMDINKLREIAISLGADKKRLYGTSKQGLIVIIDKLRKDNQKRGNDMNKVAEDFELNNLEKMGTNEYEANKNRDKHIKMYRKFANISDNEPITEETINEYALNKTATYCNREPDRIKAEILGQRYSEYEQE